MSYSRSPRAVRSTTIGIRGTSPTLPVELLGHHASLPLAFNCEVTLIDHSGTRLRIETSQGTITADKAVITVPTNLIAQEAVRFHPPLPEKTDAAAGLPLGLADKVMLAGFNDA